MPSAVSFQISVALPHAAPRLIYFHYKPVKLPQEYQVIFKQKTSQEQQELQTLGESGYKRGQFPPLTIQD